MTESSQEEPQRSTRLQPIWQMPIFLTPFIGREQEVASICALLSRPDARLLTLLGTGGIGKTRLSLQVAAQMRASFSDGGCFVSLASISDPDLVLPSIAQSLGLLDARDQSPLEHLKAYLREKHLLLLLDNFEQVLAAGPALIDLLAACPGLKILVTSRAVLRLQGEHEFPVSPLAVPDLKRLPDLETLTHYASVTLFLQRAQALKPDFRGTEGNARTIAEICVHLDGLPLAIELAAARIKLLPPQALLRRLEHRFQVLTGGAQNVPARQQTLRNTIQWSYDLLDAEEQRLFRRLSVFAGGCTLEAIEAVCAVLAEGEVSPVLDDVASLLDKSLLQQVEQEGEPRFTMLETIREYGLECLATSGEADATQLAHARYYVALTEQAEPELEGSQPALWLTLLEREYDNLRAALQWLLEWGEREQALRLGGALHRFWEMHGPVHEGRDFLARALVGSEDIDVAVRAKALLAAADLAIVVDAIDEAAALCEESLSLFRTLGDTAGVVHTLSQLGFVARMRGDLDAACSLSEQAVALARTMSDKASLAAALHGLAFLLLERGDYAHAQALFEEKLTLSREMGSKDSIAGALFQLAQVLFHAQGDSERVHFLLEESRMIWKETDNKIGLGGWSYLAGQLALSQGNAATARALLEESLQYVREAGDRHAIADSLSILGKVVLSQGDLEGALALYEESLTVAMEIGDKLIIAPSLEGLAGVVAAQGSPTWAARLLGTAEALRVTIGLPRSPIESDDYERSVAAARAQLDEKSFAAAWAEGRAMTPEQAMAAQAPSPASIPTRKELTPTTTTKTARAGLTAREVEVLRLVAQGLTDAQVAEQLVISSRTVNWHLTSIYSKLQVSSRSAATRYAIENHLV